MYDILGKFNNLDPKLEPVKETKAKETVYEEVEARGDIMEAVRSLEEKYKGYKKEVKETAKPDYIDLDKDGDKKESMKKAAKDAKKSKKVAEGEYDPAPVDPEAVAKRKRLQAIKDRQEADRAEKGDDHKSNVRTVKGKAYGGAAQKDDAEKDDLDEVAPPGAKAERMVKHIKKGYANDGKLTKKEKGIAYATAWKAHNKGKLQESRMLQEGDYFYEKVAKALAEKNPTLNTADSSFVTAVRQEMVAQGIEPNRARNIIMMDDDFIGDVATSYGHYCKEIAECNAPMNSYVDGNLGQELDEIARLAGLPVEETEVYNEVNVEESPDTMDEGNAFTAKLAQTKKGEKFELDGREFTDNSDLGESALEEEEMGEGNEFSGALAKAKAAGEKEFEVDGKKYTVKEDVNVSINANGEFDSINLIRQLAGLNTYQNILGSKQASDSGPIDADSQEVEVAEEREIEHVNTPREKVAPADAAYPSGTDMHRAKKSYSDKPYRGDNPMAVKENADDSLWKKYTGMLKSLILK